ncbi:MAG: ATP synthase F1 subunit delta [Clostridia bacterium]|jgi:F-type H+-transporting ATPase subunit delta
MPLVEQRYAQALIDIAAKSPEFDEFGEGLKIIADVYNSDEDFRYFLLNPKITVGVKQDVVKNVFGPKVKIELINYISLLLAKGRIKFLPGIFYEYMVYADKFKNTLNITIISASPLLDAQINLIKEKYKKLYTSTRVVANTEIDKNLLGGVKIRIGDKVTDGSVKGRLDEMRKLLITG